jgi:HD-GYP domain-containing protein (c-di-GMP phosphodiesterase class II)
MVLGRTLYAENGNTLLRPGVQLTQRLIDAIQTRRFSYIYVWDGVADDVAPEEVISDSVRATARRHVHDLFAIMEHVSASGPSGTVPTKEQKTARSMVSQLSLDVGKIVDEILTAETLTGVTSIKSHDNYTFEHSIEVTVAGVMLGRRLHLSQDDTRQLALGCLLHDIGKTFVPIDVLNKPSRLTDAEFDLVKQHPQSGYDAVRDIISDQALIARHVVWQHHERQDGKGYPRGLKGHNNIQHHWSNRFEPGRILLCAEIAAVADVYSALASDRPYRPAMEASEIIATLRQMSGTHLNQEVVYNFLAILPVFPVGTQVIITSGGFQGCRGVVIGVRSVAIDRPRVRVLRSPDDEPIEKAELDLKNEELCLASPTAPRVVG